MVSFSGGKKLPDGGALKFAKRKLKIKLSVLKFHKS